MGPGVPKDLPTQVVVLPVLLIALIILVTTLSLWVLRQEVQQALRLQADSLELVARTAANGQAEPLEAALRTIAPRLEQAARQAAKAERRALWILVLAGLLGTALLLWLVLLLAHQRRRLLALWTQLDESRLLARAIVEEAPDPIELVDAETMRFIEVNHASHTTLGYSRDEMLTLSVSDIQAAMSPAQLAEIMRDIQTKGAARFETHHRCKDGSIMTVRVSTRFIQQGGRAYILGMWRDITAERAAEARIRMLSVAVEQSPNAVVVTDLAARMVYVNDAVERLTGYPRDEAIGRNPRLLKSGKTSPEVYQSLWQALTAGQSWRWTFINLTKDGQERIEAATIMPLRDAEGRICNYVAIKEDITEEQRMARAKEAAEAANRAKSEFLANMSHEIRTPMNAIIGLTHLLQREVTVTAQRDRLGKVADAAHHLLAIINDILDLSKIEAGKLQLEPVDFELDRILDNVCNLVRDKAISKGTELILDVRGLPPALHGDGLRLG